MLKYDGTVVIVGAGASGLYAAQSLIEQGINVTILEAGSAVGGRVKSLRGFDDYPIELGGGVIKNRDSLFFESIQDLKLEISDVSAELDNLFFFQSNIQTVADLSGNAVFNSAQDFVDALPQYSGAGTVQSAIQDSGIPPEMFNILQGQVGNEYGGENDQIGIEALAAAIKKANNNDQLVLGSNPMQDLLYSKFSDVIRRVRFNTLVNAISHSDNEITLTTNAGDVIANKVIVTVPVSVLKQGKINFSPALPGDKLAAMSRIGMAPAFKVVFKFTRNFWGQNVQYIYGGSHANAYFNAGAKVSKTNRSLTVEAYGKNAEALAALSNEALKDVLIGELDVMFDSKASVNNALVDMVKYDWTADENVLGGFSYPLTGGSNEDRVKLAEPINKKLYFAGEATDGEGSFGTIHGAVASGVRAANEVITDILETL
nr:NAD(P)/FAD-dependent oxidoreductase [Fulvivirga sediminis]